MAVAAPPRPPAPLRPPGRAVSHERRRRPAPTQRRARRRARREPRSAGCAAPAQQHHGERHRDERRGRAGRSTRRSWTTSVGGRRDVPGPERPALAVEDPGEQLVVLQAQRLDAGHQRLEREGDDVADDEERRPPARCDTPPRRPQRRWSPSQTSAPSAAWVRPNAASRANETRLEPSRITRSNSSTHGLRRPRRRRRPTRRSSPTKASTSPTAASSDTGDDEPATVAEVPAAGDRPQAQEQADPGDAGRGVQAPAPAPLPPPVDASRARRRRPAGTAPTPTPATQQRDRLAPAASATAPGAARWGRSTRRTGRRTPWPRARPRRRTARPGASRPQPWAAAEPQQRARSERAAAPVADVAEHHAEHGDVGQAGEDGGIDVRVRHGARRCRRAARTTAWHPLSGRSRVGGSTPRGFAQRHHRPAPRRDSRAASGATRLGHPAEQAGDRALADRGGRDRSSSSASPASRSGAPLALAAVQVGRPASSTAGRPSAPSRRAGPRRGRVRAPVAPSATVDLDSPGVRDVDQQVAQRRAGATSATRCIRTGSSELTPRHRRPPGRHGRASGGDLQRGADPPGVRASSAAAPTPACGPGARPRVPGEAVVLDPRPPSGLGAPEVLGTETSASAQAAVLGSAENPARDVAAAAALPRTPGGRRGPAVGAAADRRRPPARRGARRTRWPIGGRGHGAAIRWQAVSRNVARATSRGACCPGRPTVSAVRRGADLSGVVVVADRGRVVPRPPSR